MFRQATATLACTALIAFRKFLKLYQGSNQGSYYFPPFSEHQLVICCKGNSLSMSICILAMLLLYPLCCRLQPCQLPHLITKSMCCRDAALRQIATVVLNRKSHSMTSGQTVQCTAQYGRHKTTHNDVR